MPSIEAQKTGDVAQVAHKSIANVTDWPQVLHLEFDKVLESFS
jgi:hypothetical protein